MPFNSQTARQAALKRFRNMTAEEKAIHAKRLNDRPADVLSKRNRANVLSRWAKRHQTKMKLQAING